MKIFIDIDNTILNTTGNLYSESTPNKENIAKANKLYDEGHTITYWTARGCKSGNSAEYFRLTYEQLICYNEFSIVCITFHRQGFIIFPDTIIEQPTFLRNEK